MSAQQAVFIPTGTAGIARQRSANRADRLELSASSRHSLGLDKEFVGGAPRRRNEEGRDRERSDLDPTSALVRNNRAQAIELTTVATESTPAADQICKIGPTGRRHPPC